MSSLLVYLAKTELFSGLEQAHLQSLEPHLSLVVCWPDERLIRQGEAGDALYLVVKGRLQATISQEEGPDLIVGTIGPGDVVGEMELVSGGKRTANVDALTEARLIRLPVTAFTALLQQDARLVEHIGRTILQRWHRNRLAAVLPNLFGPLALEELADLEAKLEWVHLSGGETLLERGVPGDGVYVVISGRLQAAVAGPDGHEQVVGEVVAGESVGEMAFLTGTPTGAHVYAVRDTTLVKFSTANFRQLLEQHPQLMRYLAQLVIKRLQTMQMRTGQRSEHMALAIVLLPAGHGVPLVDFAQRLADALSTFGPTLVLDSDSFDRLLDSPGAAQTSEDDPGRVRLVVWLNEQECYYRFVVYVADPAYSPWSRRCIRQADRILIVGQGDRPPDLRAIDPALLSGKRTSRRRLVLLHNGDRPPRATGQWLDAYAVMMHHHVRWTEPGDFARLARFVAGRAVGLALSGGGARGFAHIGIIRALEEAGIPIDIVGGTSMGSIIAAEYAAGWSWARMLERNQVLFKTRVLDYTLPLVSLIAGRRFACLLKAAFGELRIEDLWLPYFCVSTNLTQATMMVHRRGLVRHGTRASGGLPGLLPPFIHDGDVLIDGAWVNNLPMDIMRQLCGQGTVIAVDVSPPIDMAEIPEYGESLSGWRVFWQTLNPFAPPLQLPNIVELTQRAAEIGGIYGHKKLLDLELADLYLRPPVEHYDLLGFDLLDEIAGLAYEYARQQLAGRPLDS
ncbi:MAG: patatin-like phospholipase domain-containing protein [Chloroflexi bacterium]|nr:patatin-like phospholipase domain-containing protein [Chloroflexota bacterium]MCI0577699.1 patatin-like phospholipase domain-containing protein [Chloroflexota bacterium]MCI0645733.1 patatin-like phospholipase domain-containing protein [Chloroflexota bacterium]MCI0728231.1 patatin-like phospholipase domain-containing protein [Chloroflexota bacterium]